MPSLLRRLRPPARALHRRARPAPRCLQLALVALIAHTPLACALVAGALAESRISTGDPFITRCSPRAEALWAVFLAACGLLATAANVYCVDRLTSTPAARASRKWPGWSWRARTPAGPRSGCANSPSFEMLDVCPDEPLSPADGFSPHAGRPPPPPVPAELPPTYQQATAGPRPPMVRRSAHHHVPTRRLLHPARGGPPPTWSTRSTASRLLWTFCLGSLFLTCTAPLIASCAVQPLVRDATYAHACDGFDWEVRLHASGPAAEFIHHTQPSARRQRRPFTLHMALQRGGFSLLNPGLPAAVAYDLATHTYRGAFGGAAVGGTYAHAPGGRRRFPELGLRETRAAREDYFGFPRVEMEMEMQREGGPSAVVLATSRVKRGSCEEVKVCVRGVEAATAAVAVGPLLLETVEAAAKCRRGGKW